ncbi:MAG TPA: hypothetical protein ACFYEJ_10345 [Candidatus Wujingus californicus]
MFYKKVIVVECMGMTDREILGESWNPKLVFKVNDLHLIIEQ